MRLSWTKRNKKPMMKTPSNTQLLKGLWTDSQKRKCRTYFVSMRALPNQQMSDVWRTLAERTAEHHLHCLHEGRAESEFLQYLQPWEFNRSCDADPSTSNWVVEDSTCHDDFLWTSWWIVISMLSVNSRKIYFEPNTCNYKKIRPCLIKQINNFQKFLKIVVN